MNDFKSFLEEEWENILTVVIVFLGLLSVFAFLGINFNLKKNKKVEKTVVVESFNDNNESLSQIFCKQYSALPDDLEKKCNTLTKENCHATDCCVFLNGKKCVAGGKRGPTFLSSGEKDIDVLYYTWKGNPGSL